MSWYPGKYLKKSISKNKESKSDTSEAPGKNLSLKSPEELPTEVKSRWYPGKYIGAKKKKKFTNSEVQRTYSSESDGSDSSSSNTNRRSRTSVGEVAIKICDSRGWGVTKPILNISLEGQSVTFDGDDIARAFDESATESDGMEVRFPFLDISSDIIITLSEGQDSQNRIYGRIIIPLIYFYGLKFKPKNPSIEWRQLYPLRSCDKFPDRFMSGLEDLPESAMTKPKDSLGFVATKVLIVQFKFCPLLYRKNKQLFSLSLLCYHEIKRFK